MSALLFHVFDNCIVLPEILNNKTDMKGLNYNLFQVIYIYLPILFARAECGTKLVFKQNLFINGGKIGRFIQFSRILPPCEIAQDLKPGPCVHFQR